MSGPRTVRPGVLRLLGHHRPARRRQHALAADADIVLAAVPANLHRVLTLVGLDQVFTLRPDSSAAS
ncbi:hypothetical protein ACWCQ0_23825 [Streptomyces massasporeus]|uniref:hypothetical protein n=1 Tax=Streptomyces massasporeus TaxID=67324 RepID=UPI0033EFD58D